MPSLPQLLKQHHCQADQPTATLERVLTLAMQQTEELGSMINIK